MLSQMLLSETKKRRTGVLRLTLTETFTLLVSSLPVLFLDKSANITDVSAKYKSCHGIPCDRTVLQNSMGDSYEKLCKLCSGISEGDDGMCCVFPIELNFYTNGVFIRIAASTETVNMLCLVKTEEERSLAMSLAENVLTEETANTLISLTPKWNTEQIFREFSLSELEDDLSSYEAYLITRGFAERINRGRIRGFSKISFDGYADERISAHVEGLRAAPYADAIMKLFFLLDKMTDSKKISVVFYGGASVQIEMFTESEAFFGVADYAGYLHGLISCVNEGTVPLVEAVIASEEASLTTEVQLRDGRLSFIISSEGAQYPVMDFKFEDECERIDKLFDFACAKLILPQEGSEAEE